MDRKLFILMLISIVSCAYGMRSWQDEELLNAVNDRNTHKAKILLENGASSDACGNTKFSFPIFYHAVLNCDLDMASLLLEYGASIDMVCSFGDTVLHGAIRQGDLRMIKLLLEKGALVNKSGCLGRTPLWLAGNVSNYKNKKRIIAFLMQAGADPLIKDKNEMNALDVYRGNKQGILELRDIYFTDQFEKLWPLVRQLWASVCKSQPNDCYLGKLPSEVLCMISDYVWGTKKLECKKWKEGSAKYRKQLEESEAIES